MKTRPIVVLNNVCAALSGRTVLHSISLDVCLGECVTVTGLNGSGKTTLLRLIAGELYPSRGERTYFFDNIPESSSLAAREHIRLVTPAAQNDYMLRGFNPSVRDFLCTGLYGTPLLYQDVPPEKSTLCRRACVKV